MTNENKKRCITCECYDCDVAECNCCCHKDEVETDKGDD